ncbi:hypothetical protein UMZ34_02520 [Halopseudomonas pachastrellae]|nr:hypothetical protein UMZ34_02520 [Halopseudomonas pachastrellae]
MLLAQWAQNPMIAHVSLYSPNNRYWPRPAASRRVICVHRARAATPQPSTCKISSPPGTTDPERCALFPACPSNCLSD